MKKLLVLMILLGFLSVTVVGCGSATTKSGATPDAKDKDKDKEKDKK